MAANMVVDRIEKPMLNIFEFIQEKEYQLELGSWFRDIWFPLFKEENVLITNDIIAFLYDNSQVNNLTAENLGTWFKDIWFPLFEEKNVLITNNILTFLYIIAGKSNYSRADFKENVLITDNILLFLYDIPRSII